MPKGKGKKKKEGKKKKDDGKEEGDKPQEKKTFEPPSPSEKEKTLRNELSQLDAELESLKNQIDRLKAENDWLEEEYERTKLENQDYQTYISRRAQKRQSLIVSLGDQNRVELEQIQHQKIQSLKESEERKTQLRATLMDKESELRRIKQELKALEPYRALQKTQEEEIARLEREVEEKKFQHENRIRVLKTNFLQEQKSFEAEAEQKVNTMSEKADKRAAECLREQTQRISIENRHLRKHLQELIENTNRLEFQKKQLEKQYKKLLQEYEFNFEMRKLKGFPLSKGSTAQSNDDTSIHLLGGGYNTNTNTTISSLPQIRKISKLK